MEPGITNLAIRDIEVKKPHFYKKPPLFVPKILNLLKSSKIKVLAIFSPPPGGAKILGSDHLIRNPPLFVPDL